MINGSSGSHMANRISAFLWVWERLAFSAYTGPVVQTFNTITPVPGPLTEEKQAKMREGESRTAEEDKDYFSNDQLPHLSLFVCTETLILSPSWHAHTKIWWKRSQLMALVAKKQRVLLAPLQSPDAWLLQNRLNRLVLNRWVLADS